MEPHYQQNPQTAMEDSNGSGKSSYLCRQTSTRWTPTTDQIRILKDLYYNSGVRSPSADQIQRISARLRQYGKIEGKNVFYWFQNHKARERQKKRLNSSVINANANVNNGSPASSADHHLSFQRSGHFGTNNGGCKQEESKYTNMNSAGVASSSSSAGAVSAGQMVGGFGYGGAITMETKFRDCSISTSINSGNLNQNFNWAGMNPYAPPSYSDFFADQDDSPEIETLPLFPMHGEDNPAPSYRTGGLKSESPAYYGGSGGGNRWSGGGADGGSLSSLELSLNCYGTNSHNY